MKIERIPRDLMRTFEAVKPFEYDETFFDRLGSGEVSIRGLSPERVANDIRFLQDRGAIEIVSSPGYGTHFALTPEGREHRREIRIKRFSALCRLAVQIVAGASGGLAVYLLGQLLS